MKLRTGREAGVTLVELAVVLAIMGIVGGAVASLLGWSVQVQAQHETVQLRHDSAQVALDHIGRLVRMAGAGGKPALWKGEPDFLVLCGFPWDGRIVRASIRLDLEGLLVLAPLANLGNVPGCAGGDLPAPVNLVAGSTFSAVRFNYVTPSGEIDRCSLSSPPSCAEVTGVVIQVTPQGALSSFEVFVALRNPGGR